MILKDSYGQLDDEGLVKGQDAVRVRKVYRAARRWWDASPSPNARKYAREDTLNVAQQLMSVARLETLLAKTPW